jgi:hypothetical protein
MSTMGCAVLGWADRWQGCRSGWSGGIGIRGCTLLRDGWRCDRGCGCRREKGRKGERGLEGEGDTRSIPKVAPAIMFITSKNRSAPRHGTHTDPETQVARGGTGGTVRAQPSGAHPKLYRGSSWACSTARSAGPFVGTSSAEDDDEDVMGGEKCSPLPLHLAPPPRP